MGRHASNHSKKMTNSHLKVNIMLVDDDSTSLSIVSAMLKTCSCQDRMIELAILTVKSPRDALATLRVQHDVFDLVVTDLHMPEMNGIELQKQVDEEFKLPVIIMSSDDSENVILESLEGGAVFYIVKPANPNDLKNVWQYAVAAKKGKTAVINEIGSNQAVTSLTEKIYCEEVNSASSVNEENSSKKDSKKGKKRPKEDQEDDNPVAVKKAKVVWTNSLYNRFLQAINHIGLDKAVPKRILEFMNVPGLSRENVASHLQKYRIFLRRVADKSAYSLKHLSERALRSNFVAGHQMMLKNRQHPYSPFSGQQQMRTSFPPGFGGNNVSTLGSSSLGPQRFPNQQASSSNSVPQFPYGQSRLFTNPSSFRQTMLGNTNPLYYSNRSRFGFEGNNIGPNMLSHRGMPYALMNAANSLTNGASPMQMYQQQNQAMSNLHRIGGQSNYNFGGIQGSNYNSGVGKMGNMINNLYPSLHTNNNYAGIRWGNNGVFGTGQVQLNGTSDQLSGGFNGGYGLMNLCRSNDNMNVSVPMMNKSPTVGPLGQEGSSSAGFESANQLFPSGFNPENTSMLSSFPQQQYGLGNGGGGGGDNGYAVNPINNSSTFDSISNQRQLGTGDFSDMLLEPANHTITPYKQDGGEGAQNIVDLPNSSSYHAELNTPFYDLLNPDFLASCNLEDNSLWNEQPCGQLKGGEGAVNHNLGGNANPMGDYFPTFDQQEGRGGFMDSMLSDMILDDNAPENQGWDDEFMDSLLGNDALMRE